LGYIGVMTAGDAYTLKAATIPALPFKLAKNMKPYIDLVNHILQEKNHNHDTDVSHMENQIDLLVYHLYNLTYDEIKLIDPETPITEDEYND
jgi:adenine-specific DNA-methyltransferase